MWMCVQQIKQKPTAERDHRLSVPDTDAGVAMDFLANKMDQFRFAHFEKNFLALEPTYPAHADWASGSRCYGSHIYAHATVASA